MEIIIVDDHPIFLEGLKNLLESHDFNVIETANDGEEAILLADELRPDIILMDIHMSKVNGIEATRKITEKFPNIKIIILTSFEEKNSLFKAIKAGAAGYLLKNLNSDCLIKKLNALKEGENPFSPGMVEAILNKFKNSNDDSAYDNTELLSEKQLDIIKFIVQGFTYAQIGEELFITERTVKYHVKKIKEKIGAANKAEIYNYGVKNSLF